MAFKIDQCVAAWLWDIRYSGEQECASILLAKSIIPPIATKTSKIFGTAKQKNRTKIIAETSRELVLDGNIRLMEGDKTATESVDSFSSEFDSGYGLSLLPEGFENSHDSENISSSSESDESAKIRSQESQNLRLLASVRQENDNSSTDSARGSSPIYNSSPCHNNSPVSSVYTVVLSPATSHRAGIPFLPSYADLRESLDKILLTANHLYSQLNDFNRRSAVTFDVTREFINLAEHTSCSAFVPYDLLFNVKNHLEDLNYVRNPEMFSAPLDFINSVKCLAENVFCFFAKVIVRHLAESSNSNCLLPEALEHMTHLALFGEEICIEVIQVGGINCLTRLCRQASTPTEVLRLALRTLAVLCSVSKGCVQHLSIGGLDLVVKLLCEAPFICAVEAAGVLTQLTAPGHSCAALPATLPKVVSRLLDLCGQCRGSDGFLLCSAALANLSLQHSSVSDQLYRENAILRLSKAYHTATCQSIFAQDQIATIFARLSANGYNEALIAQGSIPCLLSLLQIHNLRHKELCKRVKYKAAICLGTIASKSCGLKAINDNQGIYTLRKICKIENDQQVVHRNDPVQAICYSLLVRLTEKYQIESAV